MSRILKICICIGFLLVIHLAVTTAPEPENPNNCALCGEGGLSYDAPYLVNLSTGEIGELRIYSDLPIQAGQKPHTGYMRLTACIGFAGFVDISPNIQYCSVAVSASSVRMNAALFCKDCRARRATASSSDVVLVDLSDRSDIHAYPILDGAGYTVRDYTVIVRHEERFGNFNVEVSAHRFDE